MTATETWRNWARNQRATPSWVHRPTDELALCSAVSNAAARGGRVKAIGAGHSFTGIARPDDAMVDLSDYRKVLRIDRHRRRATVQSGIGLRELNRSLARAGLALPNLGDIDAQTVAGAISTGTHGTGVGFHTIASAVVGLRLVTGDGSIVVADHDENPELLEVARVGLGALGLISEITLQCVPAFALEAVDEPRDVDDVIAHFDEWVDGADHAEFFWFPHTDRVVTKTSTRVPIRSDTRPRWQRIVEEEVIENTVLGAMTTLGTLRPPLIPPMARFLANRLRPRAYTAPSHLAFVTPRRVRFKEMEYNLPRSALVEAFGRVRAVIDDLARPVSFPIEVRVLGADDIPLSPAFGRDSGYIAVHVPAREPHEQYFDAVEDVMSDYGGRPHWGKLHSQTAASLRFRYPRWSAFAAARDLVDPDRRFTNPELSRVLGD